MKFETALNFILEINKKFRKCDKENTQDIYFEVLHSSLVEIISGYTKQQYENFPAPFRNTVEKLEREILDCCSMTYIENYEEYIKEHSRFYEEKNNENPEDKVKTITKCKQTIGYIVEAEEGLNI